MVRLVGLEPTRPKPRDFLTTLGYDFPSHLKDVVVWTMSSPY